VTDEELARLRAHGNNISRCRRLLKTNLSDLERRFLERRLSEERSAVEGLARPARTPRTGTAGQLTRVHAARCDKDHLKVFATEVAAEIWLKENDLEGLALE
jgi:hypothetical protein